MTLEIFVIVWLLIGLVSAILSIIAWRPNGQTKKDGELYWAVMGVVLGPITLIMLMISSLMKL